MPVLIAALAALLAARLAHVDVLWAEEGLPLAAALQMLDGKVPYRDFWFDKPPMLPSFYMLWGGAIGWPLRVTAALYSFAACWLAYRFARHLWGEREGRWAAALLAFFLIFWVHSAVTPLAADLLMLVPHLAAVYLMARGNPLGGGVLAGIAFLVNPKGLFVLAACAAWHPAAFPVIAAGFVLPNFVALLLLWAGGALGAYYEQVWLWGRVYAANTFVDEPLRNAALRTANWAGFHAALFVAAICFMKRKDEPARLRFLAWAALSFIAIALGWRFFPRYFFQLLPVAVLAAARGMELMGRKRAFALVLLLIPLIRFGPRYAALETWRDTAMDRDSRAAARLVTERASPGDTLFVWGFRPEVYAYTRLPAGTRFLDSQPLTGVPADRHLTKTNVVDAEGPRANRRELAGTRPDFVLDGLGPYNPTLAVTTYPDLRAWLEGYHEVARTEHMIVYRLKQTARAPR